MPVRDVVARLSARQRYTLLLLLAIYVLNFVDRQIVNILAEPIKRDLAISDTQLGFLTGFAFAALYATLGIPIARYADRPGANRVRIIALALFAWSGATAVCGITRTYGQLVLARVGVGIGEAGCSPAAISLIADTVPERRRASAFALYGLGVPIGGLIGLVLGGQLNDTLGWRAAFVVVGLPGIAVGALAWATLREPREGGGLPVAATTEQPSLAATASAISHSPAIVQLIVAASIVAFLGYGKAIWTGIYFIRRFDLSPGQAGLGLGLTGGLAGVAGTWLGGALAERFGARDRRHILTGPAVGMLIAMPLYLVAYTQHDWRFAMLVLAVPTALSGMYFGPLFACLQGLVRPQLRATTVAAVSFCQNFIGLGFGPLAFGFLSDTLRGTHGEASVQMVLIATSILPVVPALLFWRASLRLGPEMSAIADADTDPAGPAGPAENGGA